MASPTTSPPGGGRQTPERRGAGNTTPAGGAAPGLGAAGQDRAVTTLGDHRARTLDGSEQDLSAYAGQVVLVVNTASRCGFTPQYEGLQRLHADLADEGFAVLGFP